MVWVPCIFAVFWAVAAVYNWVKGFFFPALAKPDSIDNKKDDDIVNPDTPNEDNNTAHIKKQKQSNNNKTEIEPCDENEGFGFGNAGCWG